MKQHEIYSYVYDFTSQLMENKEIFVHLNQIILFGSVVRGDFHENSDIEIFVDLKNSEKIGSLVKKEIYKFESKASKTWSLRGISLPLKVITGQLQEERWKDLREEIRSYGKVLFGSYERLPEQGKPALLITYELKSISQKNKMALLRRLYGYKSVKKGKEYSQNGLLNKLGGKKVEANVITINREHWLSFKSLFQQLKVKYTLQEIWGK